MGDTLYLFAINWFLVSQTQNTALLGKINSISTSILLFSNLLVGPLVDQLNRKKLLIFSDLMSFIACLVCSVLYKDYLADQLILILTSAILSLALAINSPVAKVFTIIQKHSDQEFLGRVFSLLFVFSSLFSPLANVVFGKIIPLIQWQSFTLAGLGVVVVSYSIKKFFFAGE
ncbi:MFS transporter [Aerococcus urinae]|uniref:Major facilitator superfamily (MFS) profile domain-containing protein n=1 Tax=Aerococcus urinae TaxID=1376 RepID=A0A0X8FFC8_9LACT|nr:MFS transporter [Aerococcus urinae]AMB96298.1 hypothetical protein AWM73_07190 [Aerococcus urinae]MCY3032336.1 hypothetical protein [Aerococcus urinae]MCY3037841.1 hypothetical protein [Aerococcus urinae]MCY3044382.1 hypothetical protein [Aerococcus urinae]MCY3045492.1 hypothetical protein [Aerococcus urinae]